MNLQSLHRPELQPAEQEHFRQQVWMQVEKDFAMSGATIELNSQNDNETNFGLLRRRLEGLVDKQQDTLIQLMYRIDMNESQLARTLSDKPKNEALTDLMHMIIEREAKKVWIRLNH